MSEDHQKFKILEEKIPFGERLSMAIQMAVQTFCIVVTGIFLLPVNFFRTLFTTRRRVIELNIQQIEQDGPGQRRSPDDGEDWKRAHEEEYGD